MGQNKCDVKLVIYSTDLCIDIQIRFKFRSLSYTTPTHLEGKIEVEEVGHERKHLGSDECFSGHIVDQGKRLEEAHLARNRLLEGAGDHFLDGEVEDVDGGEAGEDDPVELFEQLGVWPAVEDQTPVCVADEHHPPDEAEEEGVEVGRHNHVP